MACSLQAARRRLLGDNLPQESRLVRNAETAVALAYVGVFEHDRPRSAVSITGAL